MKKAGKMIYLILIVLFLYLPILALMVFSFNEGKSMSLWTGFSLKWYKRDDGKYHDYGSNLEYLYHCSCGRPLLLSSVRLPASALWQ